MLELSWYGDAAVALPLGEAFHARRLTLKCSQVGHVRQRAARRAGAMRGAWRWRWTLLRDPALDALITGSAPSNDCRPCCNAWPRRARRPLCQRVHY